jgi:hypothetical protein
MENYNVTAEELYMSEAREQALLDEVAEEIALEEEDVCGHEDAYLMYAPFFDRFMNMDEI